MWNRLSLCFAALLALAVPFAPAPAHAEEPQAVSPQTPMIVTISMSRSTDGGTVFWTVGGSGFQPGALITCDAPFPGGDGASGHATVPSQVTPGGSITLSGQVKCPRPSQFTFRLTQHWFDASGNPLVFFTPPTYRTL